MGSPPSDPNNGHLVSLEDDELNATQTPRFLKKRVKEQTKGQRKLASQKNWQVGEENDENLNGCSKLVEYSVRPHNIYMDIFSRDVIAWL